ncbi:MAG: thymidine phosphorylase [Clostridiales bacterium]|nr:thymidine phosphorylase [Clostridiales bacterium]MDD7688937.1 thymidine phosphorylase [Clostridiales bacterium]MDY5702199.1 thymidine phosphorylase [Eubacteriales bacterium]
MHYTELIEKKRDGFTHTKEEIEFIIRGVTDGSMPDYQLTAWMMAVCFRGMTDEETAYLTDAMMHSGDVVDLSDLEGIKVDKHSTGGVGDTTTLIVAPLVAACGGTVAKVSGRGLAHSGGTLDKLESVPGVSVEKSLDEFKRIVRKTGLCVIGQSGNLDPADKRMYALRDVSGTVPSIPLIASSIMSKKLASGAEAIVLDVKTGGGAFMRTVDDARKLASLMVKIGRHLGRNTVAVITDMDRPLGMAVGNGLEMREAIEGLTGKIPYNDPLMQVSFVLAGRLLMLSNIASTQEDAEIMLKKAVEDGSGFTRLRSMLEEMGGDVRYVDDPNLLVRTKRIVPIYKDCTGYIKKLDAKSIGLAALLLGAGREKAGDTVDPAVGILMKKRCGDRIEKDEPIAYMYVNDETNLDEAVSKLVNAVCVADEKPEDEALVYDIIE